MVFFGTVEGSGSQQLGMFGSGRGSQLLDYVWLQCTGQGSDTEFWTELLRCQSTTIQHKKSVSFLAGINNVLYLK